MKNKMPPPIPYPIVQDIISPIDFTQENQATTWTKEANIKRPWRTDFFQLYLDEIQALDLPNIKVLELGSGPGHCAKFLLERLPHIDYHALDFSETMHQLSKVYLADLQHLVTYHLTDFKQPDWYKSLELHSYDVIIIHQALHELRHKAYASFFHQQVRDLLLKPLGTYLVSDHLFLKKPLQPQELFMNKTEHIEALQDANFYRVQELLEIDGLCCFQSI